MRTAVIAMSLALAALLGVAAPARARVPATFFGVMADGPLLGPSADLQRETKLMRSSGAGSVRVAFYWRDMQASAGQPVDFGESDRIVGAIARAHLQTLPVLVRAPGWATGGDEREGAVPDAAAYGAFVGDFVRRYGVHGAFWAEHRDIDAKTIRAFQIWNEPDIGRYLAPPSGTSWPRAYLPLLRAARTAIKAQDRSAKVVLAGMTNKSWRDLDKLYAAGARGQFDAAAIHPFSRRVSNVVKIVRLARGVMRRHGDARVPLMLTEISWSSGKGHSTFNYGWETTERGQASKLREALVALAHQRTKLRIGGAWWYTWLSPAIGDDESFSYGGLRRLSGGRIVSKPALSAFRSTVRRLRKR